MFSIFCQKKKKKSLSYVIPSMSENVYISELRKCTQVAMDRIRTSEKVS